MAETKVAYNYLGKTGVRVSNMCLGTMTFGKTPTMPYPTQLNEDMSHKIIDRYIVLGGNFLDTANAYGPGLSDRVVGNWLNNSVVLATKVMFLMDTNKINKVGLSRRHIIESCEESLESLQTNYIDLLQQQYSLLARQSEFEEFMVCANEGIGVLPWSPLKGGLLTGKFEGNKKPDANESRIGTTHQDESTANQAAPAWSKYNTDEEYRNLIGVLKDIAKNHRKTVPKVSLRWLLQKEVVCSVVIGVTSMKHHEDNMGASTGWSLSDEEMSRLDEASPRENLYPYEVLWRPKNVRMNPFNR